jgi:hypothetical protein
MRCLVAVRLRGPCGLSNGPLAFAFAGRIAGAFLDVAGRGNGDRLGIRPFDGTHLDLARHSLVDHGYHAGKHHLRGAAQRARDLDAAFGDGDRRTLLGHLDGEHRAFDEGDGIGRADGEMGGRLALDAEQSAAVILDHLDQPARLGGAGQANLRARRDDHIFLAAHQHGAAAGAGGDDVARREQAAPRRGEDEARTADSHGARRFRHPPRGRVRRSGRAAPQGKKQKQKESPHRRRSCPADA